MPDSARPAGSSAPVRASGPRRSAVRRLLERFGVPPRNAGRSIWFHGARPGADDAIFRELLRGRADVALVLTSGDRASVDALRARYPDDVVAALPARSSVARFIARLNPGALVLRDGAPPLDEKRLACVRAANVPVVDLGGARIDEASLAALIALLPAPAERRSPSPPTWQLPTLRDRIGQGAAWKAAAPLFMRGRIDDWDALRERLDRPRSILCLGNGPSSEDPRLAAVEHDCLIRMNWRWRERGFLDRPDVVFVGTPETLHKLPPCVFAFWCIRLEYAMLLRRLVSRGPAPLAYFTVERLTPLAAESRWPSRPTNGALAILSAAALAPERIVIGGYDLFAHPAGRYPGDASSRNAYASPHRPDVELDIIELALRDFAGEVVVMSDILRDALERRRERVRDAA